MQQVERVFTVELLADRFLCRDDRWFDIASAHEVVVRVFGAGPVREQIAWAERCAMLATLRHPLLNTLVDYGAAGPRSLFEAFAAGEPVAAGSAAASTLVTHAMRFVHAHGVSLTADSAAAALRATRRSASSPAGRPIGVVLQPRRALALVSDLIACPPGAGVTSVRVSGPPGSGVRTLQTMAGQLARAAGYVPICPAALLRWPETAAIVADRHVCILTTIRAARDERLALARLLVHLAARSARSHICLIAERADRGRDTAIHLDSMGTAQMASMIYLDSDYGPSVDEVLDASRRAAGNPGRFLAELGARPYGAPRVSRFTVHESPAPYHAAVPAVAVHRSPLRRDRSRIDAAVWKARARASELLRRGRHGAAGRLLARAGRALEGRGERSEASRCWLQLAWMSRNRGATARAEAFAERVPIADPGPDAQLAAACVVAVCRTDEGRLLEAEASLRSLAIAASTISNPALNERCLLALARVLFWDRRYDESLATLEPLITATDPEIACEALALRSRTRLMAGDLPGAIQSAREACRRAAACETERVRAGASRAMAEARLSAGDADGARTDLAAGLQAAAAARLPLATLRLRALLLRALSESGAPDSERARLHGVLDRARRRTLPALLRRVLDAACEEPGATSHEAGGLHALTDGLAHVGHFLEVAQRAPDDQTALGDVLAALCEQAGAASVVLIAADGRVIATAGKSWREQSAAAAQALASGHPVGVRPAAQQEAGEPVRCGGTLLAAIGCRWTTGAAAPPRTAALLRAASLAMAAHARGVLEAVAAGPPPGVWGDLLGDSAGAGALREAIHRASRAPFPVLIEGESGSGKELVARAIHRLSPRHTRRFCAINCAALSDDLVEAELFGHTRGAFTGATTERAGLFEEADGGTLFLDEVGELSARAQAKLLRVLQEGEVRRVGENLPRRVDVRIVAATNRHLEQEAAGGRFRTDLRFRLDVLRISVPPLRERAADIPVLAQHFWQHACARLGSKATLGADALAALARHDWPGNVRELQNAIAWIAVHGPRRGRVGAAALPAQLSTSPMATGTFEAAREEFERRFVRAALAQAGGQRQMAARALGISRQGLAKMLRRLGIEQDGAP